jgi:protein-disulfide isomerase
MRLPRRFFLAAGAAAAAAAIAGSAAAQTAAPAPTAPAPTGAAADPRLSERAIGRADAPAQVLEYFSLTCGHCAAFYRDTMPQVRQRLVEPGNLRFVYRDFPLDRLALAAAVVARSLPAERYEPFVGALLLAQDRWAFARGDPMEELAKMAALAGMARPQFDTALRDEGLARAIMEGVQAAEREHGVRSTPSFVFRQDGGRSRTQAGAIGFERFQQLVDEARRA